MNLNQSANLTPAISILLLFSTSSAVAQQSGAFQQLAKRSGLPGLIERAAANTTPPAGISTFTPAQNSIVPDLFSQFSTPEKRSSVRSQAEALLLQHRKDAQSYGFPPNDVASALTQYVYANYVAYGRPAPSAQQIKLLSTQLRGGLLASSAFRSASDSDKQQLYEWMAILGLTMQIQASQSKDAASAEKVKSMARQSWITILGIDPEQVNIDNTGLHATGPAVSDPVRTSNSQPAVPNSAFVSAALAGKLPPGGPFHPGRYSCHQVKGTLVKQYHGERDYDLNLYPDKEFGIVYKTDWKSDFTEGQYSYDASTGHLDIRYGSLINMENDHIGSTSLYYANGNSAAIIARQPFSIGIETSCAFSGEPSEPSPTEKKADSARRAEDPENFMQPKSVKAPHPPTGAGGLKGLYWRTALNNVVFMNGYPISTQGIEPTFFRPDGYYYTGAYKWGYDTLDCSRVEKNGKPMCGTYTVGNGFIQMDKAKKKFQKKSDGSLTIDGDNYIYVKPAVNLRLEGRFGTFSSITSPAGTPPVASAQSAEWTFHRDGTFEDSRAGFAVAPAPGATRSASKTTSGTYSINGYTVEFRYNNGEIRRRLCWLNTADSIYIDGTLFTQSK